MKVILLAAAAALGAWLILRRRRGDAARVVVGWEDGSELELSGGTAERERLVALTEGVLR